MAKEINQVLKLLQRMQYDEFTTSAQIVTAKVLSDRECIADNKKIYNSFENDSERFEFLNAKSFAWTMVLTDAITEVNSRLDKIEALLKEKNDPADTNDSDINIGGF